MVPRAGPLCDSEKARLASASGLYLEEKAIGELPDRRKTVIHELWFKCKHEWSGSGAFSVFRRACFKAAPSEQSDKSVEGVDCVKKGELAFRIKFA